jgi:predicted N-acetyltransferase YhbS
MVDRQIRSVAEQPGIEEYIEFRRMLGWGEVSADAARKTLDATTFCLCLRDDGDDLVGLIRVVGDGVLYLFIADVMVHPGHTGHGLGEELMQQAMQYIEKSADRWATVTLIPLAGRERFYERFGFERCPNDVYGQGMAFMKHLKA